MIAKAKELESTTTPLVKRLGNIKKEKVLETSWARIWAEIKKLAYEKKKMTEEGLKINHSTIMNYMNAPIMAILRGTKETISKFIISQYPYGKFYFNKLVEISVETIYKLTRLSNKGDPIPVGIKEGLVERLTGTPTGKNSKGLIVVQLQASTPKMVAKIVSTGLTVIGRGSDLKLNILEAIKCIA